MSVTRARQPAALPCLVVLLTNVASACGPPQPPDTRLKVRADYTSAQVITAFEKRYAVNGTAAAAPVLVEETGLTYATVEEAVAQAPDGATVKIPAGTFSESIFLVGRKGLTLRGAGAGTSIILAPQTALHATRTEVSVVGLSLVTLSVASDVPVVSVTGGSVRLSDCRVLGGTGAGVLVAGADARVTLVGNLISGNMGGGIRVQGGTLEMLRNVVSLNAVGGLVLAPSAPGAISEISLWHDTVLDNWAAQRCVSTSRMGVVPLGDPEAYRIEACILNTAGIAETFSEEFLAGLKAADNFLSATPLPAAGFFVDPAGDDFSPRAPIVKDGIGVELGAVSSAEGRAQIKTAVASAVASEKLQLAYLLSLFLPLDEREKAHEQIRTTLNRFVDDYFKTQRLGVRMIEALGLVRVAPPEWRCGMILERFLQGFAGRYSFAIKPLNFFEDKPALASEVATHLLGRTSQFPRFIVPEGASAAGAQQNAYVLSGKVRIPIKASKKSRPFEVPATLDNPFLKELATTIKMLESRLAETDAKIADIDATLNNPHMNMAEGSKYRAGMEKKRQKLREDRVEIKAKLTVLMESRKSVKERFEIKVKGEFRDVLVSGELTVQLVGAPSGDILLDEIRAVAVTYTEVEAFALPEYGFPGKQLTGDKEDPERVAANYIAEMMLKSVIASETATLRLLLERFAGGIISNTEEDQLAELLLLNAHLYDAALGAREEYGRLTAAAAAADGQVQVSVAYDPEKGVDRLGVAINVTWHDAAGSARRLAQLEDIYKPYWELQDSIDRFLTVRFGLTRKLFFKTRDVLDANR